MFEEINNKKVLITGSSSGIGSEIAKIFAVNGAHVGIHYSNNLTGAEKTLKEIKKISGGGSVAKIFKGDLLDVETRDRLISTFVDEFGGIDVLINNAGACFDYKHFSELEEDPWDKTFTVNTKVPFCLSRDAFKFMKESSGGRIINITSVAVKYVGASSLHYAASKAALDVLTTGFAKEGAKYNILVNSIRCGVIRTPMHTKLDGYKEDSFQRRVGLIPVGHPGDPVDIARMALFLAADSGKFITGQHFSVSGGD